MDGTRTRKDRKTLGVSLTIYECFDVAAVGSPSTKYIVSETLRRMSTTFKTSQTHHNGDLIAEIKEVNTFIKRRGLAGNSEKIKIEQVETI